MCLQEGRMTDVWLESATVETFEGNQSLSDRPTIVDSSLSPFHGKMKAHPCPSKKFFFA